jgi:hypothetical protein
MNVWFGTDWGAPVCQSTPRVAVPVGAPCLWCTEPIAAEDSGIGMPMMESEGNVLVAVQAFEHVECFIRQIIGSVGHQLKVCSCFGGNDACEPEGMSTRESARAAFELAQSRWREQWGDGRA